VLRLRVALLASLAACSFDGGGVGGVGGDDVAAPDATVGADAPAAIDGPIAPPDAETPPIDGPPADPPGTLHAEDAVGAVTLDGNDAEFVAAGAVALAYDIEDGGRYAPTSIDYVASARLEVRAIHDATYLYFFARVTDSIIQTDSVSDLWNDDGVALYLDVLGDALGPWAADDHELLVGADGAWGDFGPIGDPATVTVATGASTGGYALEIRVEKASLSAAVGATLGFDALITDDDGWGGDNDLDAFSVWFLSSRPACVTCCTTETQPMPWCDTTTFGTLVLD